MNWTVVVVLALVALLVVGLAMALKIINRATITAVVSLAFGIAGLLVGLGVLPMPNIGR